MVEAVRLDFLFGLNMHIVQLIAIRYNSKNARLRIPLPHTHPPLTRRKSHALNYLLRMDGECSGHAYTGTYSMPLNQLTLAGMQDVCLESGAQTVVGRSYMHVVLYCTSSARAHRQTPLGTQAQQTHTNQWACRGTQLLLAHLLLSIWLLRLILQQVKGQCSVCLTNGTARWTVFVHPFPRLDEPKMSDDRALFFWCLSSMSYRILGGEKK
jgi:hypothetical protein